MRKEVSLAIVIGVILGGVILYGIKIASDTTNSLNANPTPTPTTSIPQVSESTPSNPSSEKTKLSINSHATGQVLNDKEITLEGKTIANTPVTIIWENDETIIKSNNEGVCSQKISLIPGENNIQIDAIDENKSLLSEQIKLYYTTKAIE